jgi:predicted Zn-dependent peptidase
MYALADSSRCFPYSHSVIGSMDDLNAAKTEDVKAFFDLYYAPNNATLIVAGDFEVAAARQLIAEYFSGIPRGQDPPVVQCDQPFGSGQIRRRWPDAKANLPGVLLAYRIPEYRHADFPALSLLATILGQGESSRINKAVVRDHKLAQFSVSLLNPAAPRRGPGVFLTLAVVNQGVEVDSLESALSREVARIASEGVSPAELDKARNAYRTGLITQQQQALARAEALQSAHMFMGDAAAVNTDWRRFIAVSQDDLKRVAKTYLVPENSLALLIVPEAK